MADQVKQPNGVGVVTPPARPRAGGERRGPPRQPERGGDAERRPRRQPDDSHRIDEYV
jgi:hypothetical protein